MPTKIEFTADDFVKQNLAQVLSFRIKHISLIYHLSTKKNKYTTFYKIITKKMTATFTSY